MRIVDEALKFWRERVRGPVLRTYDEAREEPGGVPWRALGKTERWYSSPSPPPVPVPPPIPLDSGDIRLQPPSLGERARDALERLGRRGRWIAAVSTAGVLAMVVMIAASSSSAAPVEGLPPPVAQALAPLALPAHAVVAPVTPNARAAALAPSYSEASVAKGLASLTGKRAHRKTRR